MKKIILPTDFSDNAWKAMSYAATLFGSEPCHYIVINTYSMPMQNIQTGVDDFYEPLQRASNEGLDQAIADFKELDIHEDSVIEKISEFGYVLSNIIALEEKGKADVVVMGTRGVSGVGEYFIGSTTAEVMAKSKCPVICVPNSASLTIPKKIMIALDKNGLKFISSIAEIMRLAELFKSKVEFVYVVNNETDEDAQIRELDRFVIDNFYDGINHDFIRIDGEYVEDSLKEYAVSNDIQLIGMVKHERGFWEGLFHRSMTKTMAFHSDIPLFIVHD